MINDEIVDYKLRELIIVCKKTHNYKKLAVACFILLSNRINEIGLRLGTRLRDRKKDENIYEYMMDINRISEDNFKIQFFNLELIKTCKRIELLFLRSKGNFSLQQISEVFEIYYELRKIEVPDLNKRLDKQYFKGFNTLSKPSSRIKNKARNQNNNQIKNLMLYKITKKEENIRNQLKKNFNPELCEKVIALQQSIKSLERNTDNKIKIHGCLKDNFVHKDSKYKIIGFFLLGVFVAFLLFGICMIYEAMDYPLILEGIGPFILMIFGLCLLIFFIYWNFFIKEEK
ncbi:MAG: hypothetical protein KGD63_14255 [Candidatus Lokiarchaeota archaeon]|nr:hypothetical protein [Candidatus Lokiarchaeota archaeon]